MKALTGAKLLKYLLELEAKGTDLKKLKINFRRDRDSDVEQASVVEEDLFDSETNNVLESIVLIADPREA